MPSADEKIQRVLMNVFKKECEVYLDDCKTSDWTPNTNYCLNQSISTTVTCFDTDGTAGIGINCKGYTLDGDDGVSDYAIYDGNDGAGDRLTIQNCIFTDWAKAVRLSLQFSAPVSNSSVGVRQACHTSPAEVSFATITSVLLA